MTEQEKAKTDTSKRWYVMIHQKPQWIEAMLHKDSRGELSVGETEQLPPYEFFVPFQFMRPSVGDELRNDFRTFVFINASEWRIQKIVNAEWNVKSHLHLHHYRDTNRRPVIISDREMQQLRDTIMNRQLKAFFGQPVGDMAVGDTVILQFDPWQGKMGKIEKIAYKKEHLLMTVGINIMGGAKSVKFEDLRDGDVIFADREKERLLSGNLIQNFENEMVNILGHKYREKSEEKMQKDRSRLLRMLAYANIRIVDEDDQKRFTALMLICCHLLFEKEARARYLAQLQQWLSLDPVNRQPSTVNPQPSTVNCQPSTVNCKLSTVNYPQTPTEAYLMVALFICTRNPKLRDAAKLYCKTHPDCPDIIRRLLSKVRDI